MKLFERSGGYWLFWTGAIYLAVGLYCGIYFKTIQPEIIQVIWLACLALPFTYPPLGRWLNMSVEWDRSMFNMFKKKPSNVVPFPGNNETGYKDGDGPPPQEPPKKAPVTFYSLGMTSENRLEFKMGYSAITMNYGGVSNMIEQLKIYQKQLAEYEGIEEETNGS